MVQGCFFNGESCKAVVERVTDWLASVQNQRKVIAVSHGLTGRIIRGVYKQLKKEEALKLDVSHKTFFKFSNQHIERISYE
ncbi:histidine phosphatase family protein [Paenibacillus mendelii]|uniref:histidine phosphatase family protein n=1 Tax=Paenibacillus mendelii TaxID=206163 RepID=UPI0021142252|nr:histidine phosphatase family protein [Paenibacillus mendelii]MCQ6560783.1 histidine phosphatase family protein [Paenibacillus mendelii]